ncbi:MAG: O-antigen ligase family protein, partial [Candidatus Cloacimonetes bacterium]|nr:O-antigen ligase family protein [Candidatus Cloacimonadota bacterium]
YNKQFKIPKKYLIIILIAFVLIGIVVVAFAAQYFIARMTSGMNLEEDGSFLARLFKWQDNIEIWKQSPILGWGPAKASQATIVDNEYILMLRRYGIVGIIFYFLLYLIPFIDSKRAFLRPQVSENDLIFFTSMNAIIIVFLLYNVTSVTLSNIQLMDLWFILIAILYSRINSIKSDSIL